MLFVVFNSYRSFGKLKIFVVLMLLLILTIMVKVDSVFDVTVSAVVVFLLGFLIVVFNPGTFF